MLFQFRIVRQKFVRRSILVEIILKIVIGSFECCDKLFVRQASLFVSIPPIESSEKSCS